MNGSRALMHVFRLPRLLGRGANGEAAPSRGPKPLDAVVTAAVRSPKTLRIGKAAPMAIYELTLRIEHAGRRPFDVETSRVIRVKDAPPGIGDRAIVYLKGWRREVVRTVWEPVLALPAPDVQPIEITVDLNPGMTLLIDAGERLARELAGE